MANSYQKNEHGNLKYLQFGPVLAGTNVGTALTKELLDRGAKTTKSNVHDLAGHLQKENEFAIPDYVWFVENFKDFFIPYFKKIQTSQDPHYYFRRA